MSTSEPPDAAQDAVPTEIQSYDVDVHQALLVVATEEPASEGSYVQLNLEGRAGLLLRGLGRVERVVRGGRGRQGSMEVRLLELRMGTDPTSADGPRRSQPPPGPIRILVVDDDALWRRKTSDLMHRAGYHVLQARDGSEALSVALRERVHMVLSDVTMPEMDGWQLLRLLRARDELAEIPVIFLTTRTDDQERIRGYMLGVDDYIDKPYSGPDLTERVTRLLERGRLKPNNSSAQMLSGDLSRVALSSVLSFLELERRSGALHVRDGSVEGTVHLADGEIAAVELVGPLEQAPSSDRDRLFVLLDWSRGDFELVPMDEPTSAEARQAVSQLLMQYAKKKDEEAESTR
ncbi:MAG: response regulator [Myxococcales bacterium]|nr:response regulator [Myxococcales bacterium]